MHAQASSPAGSDSLPELAASAVSISGGSVHDDDEEDEALDPVTRTLAATSLQAEGDHCEAAGELRDLLVRSLSLPLSQTLTLTLTCTLPYPYPQRGPPVIVQDRLYATVHSIPGVGGTSQTSRQLACAVPCFEHRPLL